MTTQTPSTKRKRRNSDPLEPTKDDFKVPKPVFSSFQAPGTSKPNTTVPKRHESGLVWTFGMGRFMGKRRLKLEAKPSLADADGHAIPPMLPFVSSFSNPAQLSKPKGSSQLLQSPDRKGKARALAAEPSTIAKEAHKRSLSRTSTGSQLATIPEHRTTKSAGTQLDAKKHDGYGFSYSDFSDSEKRKYSEGYGFAYSDFSSDDSDQEEAAGNTLFRLQQPPRNLITPNTSFQDVIVMRDVRRSFSYTGPSTLKCTHAKLE